MDPETEPSRRDRRALVIDDDPVNRRAICEVLSSKGYEVSACGSIGEGRKFFRVQPLVVAGCFESPGDCAEFVEFVRDESGDAQPYIISLGGGNGETPEDGVNDVLSTPVEPEEFELKLKAAQAWLAGRPPQGAEEEPAGLEAEELAGDGLWDGLVDELDEEPPGEVELEVIGGDGPDDGEGDLLPEPLFDAETAELAMGLVDQKGAGPDAPAEPDRRRAERSGEVEQAAAEPPTDAPEGAEPPTDAPEAAEPPTDAPEAAEAEGAGEGEARVPGGGATPAIQIRRGSGRAAQGEGASDPTRYHLQLMVESCPLAMAMFDAELRYVFANASWRRAFGLAEAGLAGRGHFEIFSDVSERWRLMCERVLAEGDEQTAEELVEWADGSRDWVRWLVRPWYLDDGVVGGIVVSSQSITGERRRRREGQFESDVAEAAMASPNHPLVVLDANGRIVRSNRVAKKLGRWDPAEEGDVYYWEAFLPKERRRAAQEEFMDFARRLLDSGEFSFHETTIEEVVGHDDKPRRIVWTNSPRRGDDGEVCGIVRTGFDLERFEEPGHDDGVREAMLEALPVPGWRCDLEGKMDHVNSAWCDLRGREPEQELGDGWLEGVDPADRETIAEALLSAAKGQVSFSKVVRLSVAEGSQRWVRFSGEPCGEGDAKHVYGIAIDVSAERELDSARGEAKRLTESGEAAASKAARFEADLAALGVEVKRLRNEAVTAVDERDRYRSIPESAPFGIVLLGRDGKTVYANPAQAEVAGSDISSEESIDAWLAQHAPDGTPAEELVESWRAKVWRKGTAAVFPVRTDGGQVRELEFRPRLMGDGGLLVSIFDVTDTRRGEQALRASEAKFRALFHDSAAGMALADREGKIFDSNPALEALLGYSKIDLRGHLVDEFLSDEGAAELAALIGGLGGGLGRGGELVTEMETADGEPTTVHLHVSQVRAKSGELQFTTYFFHDISGQQRAERGLADQQAENRALFGASPDMIAVLDGDGRVLDLIVPADFSLDAKAGASLGRLLEEALPEVGLSGAELREMAGGDGVFTHHFRVAADPESGAGARHYELRASGGEGGGHTVMLVRDVSGLHKAQMKLKWQALTFAHIHDAIVVADMKGRVIDWNPSAEELFGFSKAEAVGMGLHQFYGGSDPVAFRDQFTGAIRNSGRWEATVDFDGKGDRSGRCEAVFVPLRDEAGAPVALVGINRDAERPGAADVPPFSPGISEAEVEAAGQVVREEMQTRLSATLKTISTLLDLQASGPGEATARTAKARVDALALLHSHVGDDGDYRTVDFGAYVRELIGDLLETEAPEETDVEVHLNVAGVLLPAGLAMPVALITNELLSNAFRHGCAGCEEAMVAVAVQLDSESGRGVLAVRDSGGRLPAGFTVEGASGLGLRIARGLAGRIGGEVQVSAGAETEFRVGFQLPPGG